MDLPEFIRMTTIINRLAKRALFAEKQMVALEGQCAEWKRIADDLKAERNALRSTTIDTAAGQLLDAFGSLANEPRNGAPDAEYRDRIVMKIHAIKLERDALKKERDDLWQREGIEQKRRIDVEEHFSDTISGLAALLGVDGGERSVTVAIEKLKAERDALRAQFDTERKPKTIDVPRAHPVPCDPPEATHDTPAGKEAAQAAAEPKPGDVVRLVRVPEYDQAWETYLNFPWEEEWGRVGETGTVIEVLSPSKVVVPVRNASQLIVFWPLSCVEVVKGADK